MTDSLPVAPAAPLCNWDLSEAAEPIRAFTWVKSAGAPAAPAGWLAVACCCSASAWPCNSSNNCFSSAHCSVFFEGDCGCSWTAPGGAAAEVACAQHKQSADACAIHQVQCLPGFGPVESSPTASASVSHQDESASCENATHPAQPTVSQPVSQPVSQSVSSECPGGC